MYPEMSMKVCCSTLSWIRSSPDHHCPADSTLCTQRIVRTQIKMCPNRARIRHSTQATCMRSNTMCNTCVSIGRRRGWQSWHLDRFQVAVLLVLRLLLHGDVLESNALHNIFLGRRGDLCVATSVTLLLLQETAGSQLHGVLAGHQYKPTRRRSRRVRSCCAVSLIFSSTPIVFSFQRCVLSVGRKRDTVLPC